jgi:hypothetical protein
VLHLASLRAQKANLFLASIVPSCTENCRRHARVTLASRQYALQLAVFVISSGWFSCDRPMTASTRITQVLTHRTLHQFISHVPDSAGVASGPSGVHVVKRDRQLVAVNRELPTNVPADIFRW